MSAFGEMEPTYALVVDSYDKSSVAHCSMSRKFRLPVTLSLEPQHSELQLS